MQTNEQRLEKKRLAYYNETEEQRERRRIWSKTSYFKHRDKRLEEASLKRKEKGIAEKRYNQKREYYQAHPLKYLLMLAKKRAKQDNVVFNLTEQDVVLPKICPILNIKLSPVFSSFKLRDTTPSLDRIDNTKGYIPGNVAIISFKANRNKGDMTLNDIERLYEYVNKIGDNWPQTH